MGTIAKPDDEEKELHDSFKNAQVLFLSEVENIISTALDHRKSEDPNYELGEVVDKAHRYAQRFSTFTDAASPAYVRQELSEARFQPHEVAMLGNVKPADVDEATHLQPSLKEHDLESLQNALNLVHQHCGD